MEFKYRERKDGSADELMLFSLASERRCTQVRVGLNCCGSRPHLDVLLSYSKDFFTKRNITGYHISKSLSVLELVVYFRERFDVTLEKKHF